MSDETMTLPTDISYTPEDVAAGAARDKLNAGLFPLIITNIDRQLSRAKPEEGKTGGSMMLVVTWRALRDTDDADSVVGPSVREYWTLPFRNKNVEGHTAPRTGSMIQERLHAIFPDEVPDVPRKIKGTLYYKGEEISRDQEDACRQEAFDFAYAKAKELWFDPTSLSRQMCYAAIFYEKDKQTGAESDFPSVKGHRPELREGDQLLTPDEYMAAPPAPATGSSKAPAKKAAAKKGGRR